MPRVPMYESRVAGRPLPTPYSNLRDSPDTFGAPVGEALQRVGGQLARVVEQEKEKHDTAQVFGAYSKLGEWQQQRLYNPQGGALSLRGKDAFDVTDRYLSDYDKV